MPRAKIDKAWGSAGTPLLPESLRAAWEDENLPQWIAEELGLAAGASFGALDQSVWVISGQTELTDRQRNFILNLVQARRSEIRAIKVFTQTPPYWLELRDLPFSTRTRNCLIVGGLLGEMNQLSRINFGRLLDIPAMGVVSILEFACVIEAAVDRASSSSQAAEPVDMDKLLAIVSESWVDQVGSADPRFSDLLSPLPYPTILETLDSLTSGPDGNADVLAQLSYALPELRRRLERIAKLKLEEQLGEFLRALSRFEGDRLSALIDRFGWNGTPPITLEEAGSRLGITRERFRQLQEKISSRLGDMAFPVYMPALDAALRLLRDKSPLNLGAACSLMKSSGLSNVEFHPASLIAAAEACSRKPPIVLQTVGKRTVVCATEVSNADAVLRVAYRQAHASGASNIGEVTAELEAKGTRSDETVVRHVLQEFSDVHFVEDGWFLHRPANPERDRLRNIARKMLSVTSPIELGLVREGVRREYRYRGHRGTKTWTLLVPPRSVMRAYFQMHPEFIVDENDHLRPTDPLDYRVELALTEAILVDVLRSSPACVLDRASLANECARRSMNANTFSIYLSYSPVIVHLGTDIWSLRGVRVDPTAIEAVRTANALREREKRVLDHGWTQEGKLWVAARLPSLYSAQIVLGIPGAIKGYLVGQQFPALDEDGVSHGTVRINHEGASYGYGSFLRRRGADEGDILITEFDLAGGAALLRLGNDELLEELSPEV